MCRINKQHVSKDPLWLCVQDSIDYKKKILKVLKYILCFVTQKTVLLDRKSFTIHCCCILQYINYKLLSAHRPIYEIQNMGNEAFQNASVFFFCCCFLHRRKVGIPCIRDLASRPRGVEKGLFHRY